MEILKSIIWVVNIIASIVIIVLVLLQHGKGADAGATFGSGSSSTTLFGARGSANFLSRTTAIFAAIFFACTLSLVVLSNENRFGNVGVMSNVNPQKATPQINHHTKATSEIPD